jgi:reverse transcriptase-like protein
MATLSSLLEKGYFPRELPPPFNTSAFAAYAPTIAGTWPNAVKQRWTRCVAHNLARPGGLRRPLKIPNPVSYFVLAELIANNWTTVRNHTWTARLSASRPYVIRRSSRAVVPRYRYSELARLRALRRRGARYLLRTDIDQFYPSIYTHAVPWALHTKAACRAALLTPGRGMTLVGNQIDKALQCMGDGQTHGIPIGPDSSLVVAEILLSSVDQSLLSSYPNLISGFRYVDDYELSFAKLSEAEQILTELQGLLAEYGLIVNPRKTALVSLPKAFGDTWGDELGRFQVRGASNPVAQRNDLMALFNRAFEIASERPHEPVLKYAVARVQNLPVHLTGWRAFQNCILGAASADPAVLAVALGTLYQVATLGGHAVARSPLAEVFESVIADHAPRAQGSEVSWALWGALAWSVPLSDEAARSVSDMNDDVVALLALDADSRGLFPLGSLNTTAWSTVLSDPAVLIGEHWLLAYEANQQHWLVTPAVATDPVFSAMSAAGVTFYDPLQATPQFPVAGRGLPGGVLADYYA